MRVVAFTGMPGAGKSEAVEEARRRNLPVVSMGDFVREAVRGLKLDPTDENVGRVATQMRKDRGADYWAQLTTERVLSTWKDAPLVVIDGVRTMAEIETFRKRLGTSFHLVAIEAPFETRAARLRGRGRPDDAASQEMVRKRDEREIGWGIHDAIASADMRIQNTPPLEAFRRRMAKLFDELTREGAPSSTATPRGGAGTRP